jgi:hypothetical protein
VRQSTKTAARRQVDRKADVDHDHWLDSWAYSEIWDERGKITSYYNPIYNLLLDAVDGDLGRGLTYSWLAQLFRADCYGGRAYHSDSMRRGIEVRAAAIAAHTGQHHGTVNKQLAWLRERELITTDYLRRTKTIVVGFNWSKEQLDNQLWLMRDGYVDIPDRVRCAFDSLAVAVVAADAMHWMGVNGKGQVKTREKVKQWRVFYKSERRWAKTLHMPRTTVQECIDKLCAEEILLSGGMRKNQGGLHYQCLCGSR